MLTRISRLFSKNKSPLPCQSELLQCTVSYNKYGGYCVPLASIHRPVPKKILAGKVHEPDTIKFMVANCGDADIVHAGAYFGDFLPALSRAVASGKKVWAFEPNCDNYRCAEITLAINGSKNIELINAGLGAKSEFLQIQTEDSSGRSLGGASRIVCPGTAAKSQNIQIVAIDDAIDSERPISIIQLDVEGYEKEALMGAENTIRRCFPILILEVWRDSNLLTSDWFKKNILGLGYRQTETLHGNKVFERKS